MSYEEYLKLTRESNITYEEYKQIIETTNLTFDKYIEILRISDMTYEEYGKIIEGPIKSSDRLIRNVSDVFYGKWNINVLFELNKNNSLRFGELKRSIPNITNTMLTNTLRDLEDLGVVYREQFNEIPLRVEYSITESGKDLVRIFFELSKWANAYLR